MAGRRDRGIEIEFALRRHFSAGFTAEERRDLVEVIRAWDSEHPDLDPVQRQRGWLEIARCSRPQ